MADDESKKVKIPVPSKEEKKKESIDEKKQAEFEKQLLLVNKPRDDAPDDKFDELTQEDKDLKERLELMVTRVVEEGKEKESEYLVIQRNALESLRNEIRSSTSSMTSVPKPLKFLRPFYSLLKNFYQTKIKTGENKRLLSDILSVLAITMAADGSRESLKFKLEGTKEALSSWGHEYVRNLAGEIGQEWAVRLEKKQATDDLLVLVEEIIPFNLEHNAENEAIDLLLEVNLLSKLSPLVKSADRVPRICKYLLACCDYLPDPDDKINVVKIAFQLYFDHKLYPDALRVAIKLDDRDSIARIFKATEEKAMLKQLGLILGSVKQTCPSIEDSDINEIIGNVHLNGSFLKLGADLDVKEAKTPEDIFKSHLVDGNPNKRRDRNAPPTTTGGVDNAKQNLASTFVNAFVNCGFGKDLLMTPEGSDWVFKTKEHGMLSATASLGLILLWDVETGYSQLDKYTFHGPNFIKAGAYLAMGMIGSGVTSEMDAALALLSDHVNSENLAIRTSAILGLGLAYAGTARQDVLEILTPIIVQGSQPIEIVALTCLSLGFVFCGTADDVSETMIEAFMERSETDLKDSSARLMCLGLGLIFLGKGEAVEAVLMAIKAISHPISKYLEIVVETCAYVGTGSVLMIQKLLSILTDHIEDDEKDPFKNMHQEVAVLGIAMVALGEDLSVEMALRSLDHVLQYGEVNVRRAVPLALALLSISHPRLLVIDNLAKLSHDQDERVSQNSILSLGFIGAGTNNSRIASILRNSAVYYAKEANHLFLVRIAQGLLHLGKGLMTLSPFQSDGFLLNKVAIAGLLTVFHSAFDLKNSILSKRHYILYTLVTAIRPRMLVTVDEDMKALPVTVRVGQAVDTTGQAGKPKTITGFQTHTTPVLLAAGERAELGDDKYLPLTSVLEGFVIVKKNPNYHES